MRHETKKSVRDNLIFPVIVAIISAVAGGIVGYFVNEVTTSHDVISLDSVSTIIDTYLVDTGLVDDSILELDSPQEQIKMLADIISESEEQYVLLQEDYQGLEEEYNTLSASTLASLSEPSLVIQGESIDTTLNDYVAIIDGKTYYLESLLNGFILTEEISVEDGSLYYGEAAEERVSVVKNNLYHDVDGEIVGETSDYVLGSKTCTYGFIGSSTSSVIIECDENYSQMEFNLGYVNDSGDGDRTLTIYYLSSDGEYISTYSKVLTKGMLYYENETCQIYNTQRVKIEITYNRYKTDSSRFGLSDIYLVK